jgi:hypothetical protein
LPRTMIAHFGLVQSRFEPNPFFFQ